MPKGIAEHAQQHNCLQQKIAPLRDYLQALLRGLESHDSATRAEQGLTVAVRAIYLERELEMALREVLSLDSCSASAKRIRCRLASGALKEHISYEPSQQLVHFIVKTVVQQAADAAQQATQHGLVGIMKALTIRLPRASVANDSSGGGEGSRLSLTLLRPLLLAAAKSPSASKASTLYTVVAMTLKMCVKQCSAPSAVFIAADCLHHMPSLNSAGSCHRAHVPEYFLALKRCLATLTHHLKPEMVEQVGQCCIHVLSTQATWQVKEQAARTVSILVCCVQAVSGDSAAPELPPLLGMDVLSHMKPALANAVQCVRYDRVEHVREAAREALMELQSIPDPPPADTAQSPPGKPVSERSVLPIQLPTDRRRRWPNLLMPQRPAPSVPQFPFRRPQLSPKQRRQLDFGVQIFCPLLPQQQPIPLGDRPSDYSSTSPNPIPRAMEVKLSKEEALTVEPQTAPPGPPAVKGPEPLVSPRLAGEALPHLRQVQQTLVWASQLLGRSIDLAEKGFAPSTAENALERETPAGEANMGTSAIMLKICGPQQHSTAPRASGHAACHDRAGRQELPASGSPGTSSPDCPTIDNAAGSLLHASAAAAGGAQPEGSASARSVASHTGSGLSTPTMIATRLQAVFRTALDGVFQPPSPQAEGSAASSKPAASRPPSAETTEGKVNRWLADMPPLPAMYITQEAEHNLAVDMSPGLLAAPSDVHIHKQTVARASATPRPTPPATALVNKQHVTKAPSFPDASTAAEIFNGGRAPPVVPTPRTRSCARHPGTGSAASRALPDMAEPPRCSRLGALHSSRASTAASGRALQEVKRVQDRKLSAQGPSAPQKGNPVQHGRQPRLVKELRQQTFVDRLNTFTSDQAQEGVLDFVAAAAQEAEVRQFLMGNLEETGFKLLRSQPPEVNAQSAKGRGPSDGTPAAEADDSSEQHLQPAANAGEETATESLPTSDVHRAMDGLLDFEEAAAYEAEVRQFLAGSLEETTFKLLRSGRPKRDPVPGSELLASVSAPFAGFSPLPSGQLHQNRIPMDDGVCETLGASAAEQAAVQDLTEGTAAEGELPQSLDGSWEASSLQLMQSKQLVKLQPMAHDVRTGRVPVSVTIGSPMQPGRQQSSESVPALIMHTERLETEDGMADFGIVAASCAEVGRPLEGLELQPADELRSSAHETRQRESPDKDNAAGAQAGDRDVCQSTDVCCNPLFTTNPGKLEAKEMAAARVAKLVSGHHVTTSMSGKNSSTPGGLVLPKFAAEQAAKQCGSSVQTPRSSAGNSHASWSVHQLLLAGPPSGSQGQQNTIDAQPRELTNIAEHKKTDGNLCQPQAALVHPALVSPDLVAAQRPMQSSSATELASASLTEKATDLRLDMVCQPASDPVSTAINGKAVIDWLDERATVRQPAGAAGTHRSNAAMLHRASNACIEKDLPLSAFALPRSQADSQQPHLVSGGTGHGEHNPNAEANGRRSQVGLQHEAYGGCDRFSGEPSSRRSPPLAPPPPSKLRMPTIVCRPPVMCRGKDQEADQRLRPLWLDDIPSDGLPQLQADSLSRPAQRANHLAGRAARRHFVDQNCSRFSNSNAAADHALSTGQNIEESEPRKMRPRNRQTPARNELRVDGSHSLDQE